MKKEGAPALLWRSPGLLLPRTVLRPLDWLGAGPAWASSLSWSGRHGPHPLNSSVVWLYDAFRLLGSGSNMEMVNYQEHRAHTPHRVSTARRGWISERVPRAPRLSAETTLLSEGGRRRTQPAEVAQAHVSASSRRITPAPEVEWTAAPRRKAARNPIAEPASRPVIRWSEPEGLVAKSPSFQRTATTGERIVPKSPPWGAPELVTASPASVKTEVVERAAPKPPQTTTSPRTTTPRGTSQPSLQPRQARGTQPKTSDKTATSRTAAPRSSQPGLSPRADRTQRSSQPGLTRREPVRVEGRRKLQTLSWQRPEKALRLPLAAPSAEPVTQPGRSKAPNAPATETSAPRKSLTERREVPRRPRVPTVRWSEPEGLVAKSPGFHRTTTGERIVPKSPPWGAPELVTASPASAKTAVVERVAPKTPQTTTSPRTTTPRGTSQPSLQPRQARGTQPKTSDKTETSRTAAPRASQPGLSPRADRTQRSSQPGLTRRDPVRVEGRRKLQPLSWQRPEKALRLPLAAPASEPIATPGKSRTTETTETAPTARRSLTERREVPR
ncbi:MAG: hypothetical protein ACI8RZ_003316, partial [Myxococcota bacterium]